tara:strand:+ start:1613 stop:2002 length:390 start_codon:yes stop_codon:yes gene_type:complete
MKISWVNGCFDVLHRGHLELFKFAKSKADLLFVGIDADARVKQFKGDSRPINNQQDRKFFLESLRFVDRVVVFNNEDQLIEIVKMISPDYMIIGSDYKYKRVIAKEHAKELIFFDRIGDYSTTNILERK